MFAILPFTIFSFITYYFCPVDFCREAPGGPQEMAGGKSLPDKPS